MSGGIFDATRFDVLTLRADARRTTTRGYGSDLVPPAIPQASGADGRTAPSEKVIELSAYAGLVGLAERHNSIPGWGELTC
jgi:hypothetical protein